MLGNARNIHQGCIWAKKTEWRSLKRRTKQRRSETNKVNKSSWLCPWTICFLMADLSFPSCSPSLCSNHRFRLPLCCNQPTLFLTLFQTKTQLNESICTAFIFSFIPSSDCIMYTGHSYHSGLMKNFSTWSSRWSGGFQLASSNYTLLLVSFYLDTDFTG